MASLGLDSDEKLNEIIQHISENDFCIIQAPTGSGKSTAMIKKIASVQEGIIVFVVEPTILTTYDVTTYMKEKNPSLSIMSAMESEVTYSNRFISQVRGQRSSGEDTSIVYCTAGHMLLLFLDISKYMLLKSPDEFKSSFCDVLVIDEAHIGTLDLDTIMLLWKNLYMKGYPVPKLVLSSATITPESTPFPEAAVHKIQSIQYKVTIRYVRRKYKISERSLYTDTAEEIKKLHREFPPKSNRGNKMLVFCPGKAEIKIIEELINGFEGIIAKKITSKTKREDREKVLELREIGKRVVILVTNIAEMGITFDELDIVVDTLTEKLEGTTQAGTKQLTLSFISQFSANQRAGRAGRTGPGLCLRMTTEDGFLELQSYRLREIERVPLQSMIIRLMGARIDPKKLYKDYSNKRINEALKLLESLSMIEKEKVTEMGYFAAESMLSVKGSAVVWKYLSSVDKENSVYPIVVIMALIDNYGRSYFLYPKKIDGEKPEEYQARKNAFYDNHFSKYDAKTDIEVLVNIWNTIPNNIKTENTRMSALNKLLKYTKTNYLFFNGLKQVIDVIFKMKKTMIYDRMKPVIINYKEISGIITDILKDVFRDSIMTYKNGKYYDSIGNFYFLSNQDKIKSEKTNDKNIIGLNVFTVRGNKTTRLINISHPFDREESPPEEKESPPKEKESPPKEKEFSLGDEDEFFLRTPPHILLGEVPEREMEPPLPEIKDEMLLSLIFDIPLFVDLQKKDEKLPFDDNDEEIEMKMEDFKIYPGMNFSIGNDDISKEPILKITCTKMIPEEKMEEVVPLKIENLSLKEKEVTPLPFKLENIGMEVVPYRAPLKKWNKNFIPSIPE